MTHLVLLCLLVSGAAASYCTDPPNKATQAWLDEIVASGCTIIDKDVTLGYFCAGSSCDSYSSGGITGVVDFGSVTTINGRLTIYGDANIPTIRAPNLKSVHSLEFATVYFRTNYYRPKLATVDMPALEIVKGEVVFNGLSDDLDSVNFPKLQRIEGRIFFYMCWKLAGTLSLPDLEEVTGSLYFRSNPFLETVNVTSLVSLPGGIDTLEGNNGQGSSFAKPITFTVSRGSIEASTYDLLSSHAGAYPKYQDLYDPNDCPQPPTQATRAYINTVISTGCTRIVGDLYLGAACNSQDCGPNLPDLSGEVDLGSVITITGLLTIYGASQISTLRASNLQSAGSLEIGIVNHQANYYRPKVTTVDLPALEILTGPMRFNGVTDNLATINLPSLKKIEGRVYFYMCWKLAGTLSLPALEEVTGSLYFRSNSGLNMVDVPSLRFLPGGIDTMQDNNYDDPLYEPLIFQVTRCLGINATAVLDGHAGVRLRNLDTPCPSSSSAPTSSPTPALIATDGPSPDPTPAFITAAPSFTDTTAQPTPAAFTPATVRGIVYSATTKRVLAGVTMVLRLAGSPELTQSSFSGSTGSFSFAVSAPGSYEMSASADGYITRTINLGPLTSPDPVQVQMLLSPVITTANTYRFVLEWGSEPEDLDSYLILVDADCEVRWSNKNCAIGQAEAHLDVDSTRGFGPETITLQGAKGLVGPTPNSSSMANYVVKQFSAWGTLVSSSATVAVYNNDGVVRVLDVPACGADEKEWNVASVDMTTGQLLFNEDRLDGTDPCLVPFITGPGNGGDSVTPGPTGSSPTDASTSDVDEDSSTGSGDVSPTDVESELSAANRCRSFSGLFVTAALVVLVPMGTA